MAKRRFVNGIECRNLLNDMAQKRVRLTLTNRSDNVWRVYKSQFISLRGNQLILAQPIPDTAETPMEAGANQEIAISFKKGYNKYLFLTKIIKVDKYEEQPGRSLSVLHVYTPDHVEKIQRRAFTRADVPAESSVEVKFWRTGSTRETSWTGMLSNVSAGGIGVTINAAEFPELQESEQITLEFMPLPDQKPIVVDARFRHGSPADQAGKAVLGFQFIGLEISEEGRAILRRISRAVGVYLRKLPLSAEHAE